MDGYTATGAAQQGRVGWVANVMWVANVGLEKKFKALRCTKTLAHIERVSRSAVTKLNDHNKDNHNKPAKKLM